MTIWVGTTTRLSMVINPHRGRDVMESQVVTATEVIGIFLRGEGNLWGEQK